MRETGGLPTAWRSPDGTTREDPRGAVKYVSPAPTAPTDTQLPMEPDPDLDLDPALEMNPNEPADVSMAVSQGPPPDEPKELSQSSVPPGPGPAREPQDDDLRHPGTHQKAQEADSPEGDLCVPAGSKHPARRKRLTAQAGGAEAGPGQLREAAAEAEHACPTGRYRKIPARRATVHQHGARELTGPPGS